MAVIGIGRLGSVIARTVDEAAPGRGYLRQRPEAVGLLRPLPGPGDGVLVKGSRGTRDGARGRGADARPRGGDGLMLYHLLFPLADRISQFNVFRYITFRTAWRVITALVICFSSGPG